MDLVGKAISLKKKNPVLLIAGISLTAGALIFAGVKTYRTIKNSKAERDAEKKLKEIREQGTDKLIEQATTRTITDNQAEEYARQLLDAMNGIGTDEEKIKRIIIDEGLTGLDLNAIVEKFGIKDYGTFGEPLWGEGEKLNLMQWINKEIASSSSVYELLKIKFTDAGLAF